MRSTILCFIPVTDSSRSNQLGPITEDREVLRGFIFISFLSLSLSLCLCLCPCLLASLWWWQCDSCVPARSHRAFDQSPSSPLWLMRGAAGLRGSHTATPTLPSLPPPLLYHPFLHPLFSLPFLSYIHPHISLLRAPSSLLCLWYV